MNAERDNLKIKKYNTYDENDRKKENGKREFENCTYIVGSQMLCAKSLVFVVFEASRLEFCMKVFKYYCILKSK